MRVREIKIERETGTETEWRNKRERERGREKKIEWFVKIKFYFLLNWNGVIRNDFWNCDHPNWRRFKLFWNINNFHHLIILSECYNEIFSHDDDRVDVMSMAIGDLITVIGACERIVKCPVPRVSLWHDWKYNLEFRNPCPTFHIEGIQCLSFQRAILLDTHTSSCSYSSLSYLCTYYLVLRSNRFTVDILVDSSLYSASLYHWYFCLQWASRWYPHWLWSVGLFSQLKKSATQ